MLKAGLADFGWLAEVGLDMGAIRFGFVWVSLSDEVWLLFKKPPRDTQKFANDYFPFSLLGPV